MKWRKKTTKKKWNKIKSVVFDANLYRWLYTFTAERFAEVCHVGINEWLLRRTRSRTIWFLVNFESDDMLHVFTSSFEFHTSLTQRVKKMNEILNEKLCQHDTYGAILTNCLNTYKNKQQVIVDRCLLELSTDSCFTNIIKMKLVMKNFIFGIQIDR